MENQCTVAKGLIHAVLLYIYHKRGAYISNHHLGMVTFYYFLGVHPQHKVIQMSVALEQD